MLIYSLRTDYDFNGSWPSTDPPLARCICWIWEQGSLLIQQIRLYLARSPDTVSRVSVASAINFRP
eukprot:scaffold141148_cov34-Tisochrysis_lutea.AAC.1